MNPNNMTRDPGMPNLSFRQNFSVSSANPLNWTTPDMFNGIVSSSMGFNLQPQLALDVKNFQFGNNHQSFQRTVQFPFLNESNSHLMGYKRKTESPPPRPAKQLITEEKMSEHLQNLHISSEAGNSGDTQEVKEQRLYMCEEMRKLQAESILPSSLLLSSIPRTCTALVLWQPRNSILTLPYDNYENEHLNSANNNNNNNNNNTLPDHNVNPSMEFDDM